MYTIQSWKKFLKCWLMMCWMEFYNPYKIRNIIQLWLMNHLIFVDGSTISWEGNFNLWIRKLRSWSTNFTSGHDLRSNGILDVLHLVPKMAKLIFLIRILPTIPTSTCTCEHSFLAMLTFKSYLRSTRKAERLNHFSILNIHRSQPCLKNKH